MKRVITLLTALLLMNWSVNAWAFTCKTPWGQTGFGGGNGDIYINIEPTINLGESFVIDLSSQIFCTNDATISGWLDYISLDGISTPENLSSGLFDKVEYNNNSYDIPFISKETSPITMEITLGDNYERIYHPIPIKLYISPKDGISGTQIKSGEIIANISFHQTNNMEQDDGKHYSWNIHANNDVVVPTGTCSVSSYNTEVKLPDYSGNSIMDVGIPLEVYCLQEHPLTFYLSGTTLSGNNSIFTNIDTNGAQGVGVQLKHNGKVLANSEKVSLGNVGSNSKSLGLTANYAFPVGKNFTAGNVKSIIGVVFAYE